jgi:hypothetical protein
MGKLQVFLFFHLLTVGMHPVKGLIELATVRIYNDLSSPSSSFGIVWTNPKG